MLRCIYQPLSMLYGAMMQPYQRYRLLGLGLSLAIALCYGWLALQQAFAGAYVVQDDARQHVFWMQRFTDPDIFPNDLIANYFQGVAPPGYAAFYQLGAILGISPFFLSKILPFFLSLITVGFVYEISWTLLPIPLASFIASVSFGQSIWCSSEHASATPRAFLYPLLLAFIYFLMRQKYVWTLASLILQALFYPQISLVCLGTLAVRLLDWKSRRISWSKERKNYVIFVISFCIIAGILLYAQGQSNFGPIISRSAALSMPEFQPNGRNGFFYDGFYFWLYSRGGLLHPRGFTPALLVAGTLSPMLLWLPINRAWRSQIRPQIWVLLQLLVAAFALFLLAHQVLFRLHLPSRYSSHAIRAVLGITCGLGWVIFLNNLAELLSKNWRIEGVQIKINSARLAFKKTLIFSICSAITVFFLLAYPALFFDQFPRVGYYDFSNNAELFEFYAAQPKDVTIASLSPSAANIPMFSSRTVLVSPEHALAYHTGFYGEFSQRVEDLIAAQFTDDPALLSEVISSYAIDSWLIDNWAFQPAYIQTDSWLMQYQPIANKMAQQLTDGRQSVLQQSIATCQVAGTDAWAALDASCVKVFADELSDRQPKTS
ncbi:MAG: hypothetical protein ACFB0E_12245 [Leptolyngbyaceae cyanobacterium]